MDRPSLHQLTYFPEYDNAGATHDQTVFRDRRRNQNLTFAV
ncbi:MAG TPA: hypothetical protein VMB73_08500 [Acetobacteraceae bacterium]|nr:hypothetical protein [Acetobacteraceae bacterium]